MSSDWCGPGVDVQSAKLEAQVSSRVEPFKQIFSGPPAPPRNSELVLGETGQAAAQTAAKKKQRPLVKQLLRLPDSVREIGGAPRDPAPRNHFLVRIVRPSGCHCTDALGGTNFRRVPTPLRSISPFSDSGRGCRAPQRATLFGTSLMDTYSLMGT